MLEKGRKFYLEVDKKGMRQYVVEQADDGRIVLLACGPEAAEPAEAPQGPETPEIQQTPDSPQAPERPAASSAAAAHTATLAEYARKWLDFIRYQVKESTYIKYWNLLYSYIIPELGGIRWDVLNRETIELFCGRMRSAGGRKQSGLSAKTVADTMSVLRRIFGYAADHGAAMPCNIASITVKKEPKEMKVLTRKEQDKLYRYLRTHPTDRSLGILICMFTGLRLGEICALKWEDISFSENMIYVHRTMQRIQTKDDPGRKTKIVVTPPKSGSSVRKIPIPRELTRILFSGREKRKGYVLTGREDAYVEPRAMERHFAKVLEQAGIGKINFHALRHTFATRCVEMDFDIKSLSEILGHANVNITLNRYVHPTMELKRRNMQKLSMLLAVGW